MHINLHLLLFCLLLLGCNRQVKNQTDTVSGRGNQQVEQKLFKPHFPELSLPAASKSIMVFSTAHDGGVVYACGQEQRLFYFNSGLVLESTAKMETEKEQQFLTVPTNSAQIVETADFDLDGDLDRLTLSFSNVTLSQPTQSISYYECLGEGEFKLHTFHDQTGVRWRNLVVEDWDNDGDIDFAVSGLVDVAGTTSEERSSDNLGPPFIVWENQIR